MTVDATIESQEPVGALSVVWPGLEGVLAAERPECKIVPEVVTLEVSVAGPIVGRLEVVSTW